MDPFGAAGEEIQARIWRRGAPRRLTSLQISRWLAPPISWCLRPARGSGPLRLAAVSKALVIRLDEIGDIVLTSPLLRELRRNLPAAWITLLVRPETANLVERCPYVNEVLTFDTRILPGLKPVMRHYRAVKLALARLRPRGFDLAILPRWDVDSHHATFVAYFSGARWRVGFASCVNPAKGCLNRGYDTFLTHTLHDIDPEHEVQRGLGLLSFLGGVVEADHTEAWLDPEDSRFAAGVLAKMGVARDEELVALATGAGAAKRRMPTDLAREIVKMLLAGHRCRVLILGDRSDAEVGAVLADEMKGLAIDLCGLTTLRQAAAVISACRVFVGTDAGLCHLAAAVGTPVVVVSCHPRSGSLASPNAPARFSPWTDRGIVLQPNAADPACALECIAEEPHCIKGVSAAQVCDSATRLLGSNWSGGE